MDKKMKAIYLKKYGNADKTFEVREAAIPKAAKGEIVIKVAASGINFADVVARRGLYPDAPKNPAILGYDVAGTVHEVGEDVEDGPQVGQRVTALTRFGGYAEYASTMSEGVAVIPDDMSYAEATAYATQACTAYYCALESVTLHEGDHVLIQAAAGGVGCFLVQLAKYKKCVIVGTASTGKIDYLHEMGVDHPIDYTQVDFLKKIQEIFPDHGIDVAFDSVGGKVFKKSYKSLAPGGRVVTYGAAAQINGNKTNVIGAGLAAAGFGFYSPIQFLMGSKAIIGVNMLRVADNRPHVFKKCLEGVIELAREKVLHGRLDSTYNYKDIAKAHERIESRKSMGKIALLWE